MTNALYLQTLGGHDSGYLSNLGHMPYEETHFEENVDDIIVSKKCIINAEIRRF